MRYLVVLTSILRNSSNQLLQYGVCLGQAWLRRYSLSDMGKRAHGQAYQRNQNYLW